MIRRNLNRMLVLLYLPSVAANYKLYVRPNDTKILPSVFMEGFYVHGHITARNSHFGSNDDFLDRKEALYFSCAQFNICHCMQYGTTRKRTKDYDPFPKIFTDKKIRLSWCYSKSIAILLRYKIAVVLFLIYFKNYSTTFKSNEPSYSA